ncbi:hypothetical protein BU24DRAFT_409905 [Aaosphaeria arxii CBS 175.79]|uniref:Uncharacterized protein n=1 Tax=Aaosphaeria arxii CBS 175.79 TaxID=1450172 RepID=A0A6A5XLI5_9PLEO|nr:uncharacterized protein BU24DRAFT_409905 [Aaosphaeria arxii CBS 175.79]KAF2014138.1 hypothetical protein BU24DRAFT_409905 [Aaosphaeria arxii CBS 175.79]
MSPHFSFGSGNYTAKPLRADADKQTAEPWWAGIVAWVVVIVGLPTFLIIFHKLVVKRILKRREARRQQDVEASSAATKLEPEHLPPKDFDTDVDDEIARPQPALKPCGHSRDLNYVQTLKNKTLPPIVIYIVVSGHHKKGNLFLLWQVKTKFVRRPS